MEKYASRLMRRGAGGGTLGQYLAAPGSWCCLLGRFAERINFMQISMLVQMPMKSLVIRAGRGDGARGTV
jgi:hypothetical protein